MPKLPVFGTTGAILTLLNVKMVFGSLASVWLGVLGLLAAGRQPALRLGVF